MMVHTTIFVTPVVEHWLEREIARWVHHEVLIRRSIAPRANALPRNYISPVWLKRMKHIDTVLSLVTTITVLFKYKR